MIKGLSNVFWLTAVTLFLIYEYFLKLNTGGKPVEESHLNKVRELLNNAKKTNK